MLDGTVKGANDGVGLRRVGIGIGIVQPGQDEMHPFEPIAAAAGSVA